MTNSTLPLLKSALEKHHGKEQLVVGDFNMHHSRWDGDNYRRSRNTPSTQTDFMIAMMERWGLNLCLEQGTITRPPSNLRSNQGSTIDLVWATAGVQGMIRNCGVNNELDCASEVIATVVFGPFLLPYALWMAVYVRYRIPPSFPAQ
jgi:hypothetical protein